VPAPLVLPLEEALQRRTAWLLRRLGRPVRAFVFPGFGTGRWVRVRGRVLVAAAPRPDLRASTTWSALRANLAQFLTVEVPYARVRVDVGHRSEVVLADREGYVDAVLDGVALPPGRHTATLTPLDPPGEAGAGTVHVPDPAADLVVISDIDDTIVDSGIAHGLLATITTALLRPEADRVPLDGAPELYQALARGAGGPSRPFLYLSTSPWNLVGFLQRFLERHGFPDGPLLLTDWGPGAAGLFRVQTRAHKSAALRDLATVLPRVRFVLVGDSGQQDPEIYTSFAVEHPGRVAAVYIRRAGAETASTTRRVEHLTQTLREVGVPFVLADDSAAMLRHALELGLTTT
jgi:phosphatidate phosphatase APP1